MEDILALLSAAEENIKNAEHLISEAKASPVCEVFDRYPQLMARIEQARASLASEKVALLRCLIDTVRSHRHEVRYRPSMASTLAYVLAAEDRIRPDHTFESISVEDFVSNPNYADLFWGFVDQILNVLMKHLEKDPKELASEAQSLKDYGEKIKTMHLT